MTPAERCALLGTRIASAGRRRRMGALTTFLTMETIVQVSKLTKRYGNSGRPALDEVSLDITAGEAIAIMGPSGSGKSTLLNLIAGLDRPTSGSVIVAGQRVDALSETGSARFRRTSVGMIFQFFNLLDDLTVADNGLLPAQLAGMRRGPARARADELLTALHIRPQNVSGGDLRDAVMFGHALGLCALARDRGTEQHDRPDVLRGFHSN